MSVAGAARSPGTDARQRPTLLIAGDDAGLRELLALQLSEYFDVVALAANAGEAIALGAEHQPDLALIDMQMPGGGGLSAARELSRRAPAVAIVALSVDVSHQVVRAVIAGGAISYLRKGMARSELALALLDARNAHSRLQLH